MKPKYLVGLILCVQSLKLGDNPWDTMIQMNSMTDEVVQKHEDKPKKVDELEKKRKD